MDDPNPNLETPEVDEEFENEPRSYALDYVVLDRSASDDPVWVLCRFTAVRAAQLDHVGNPTSADQLNMLQWVTQELMKVLNPRPVPGGGFTYRLDDGEG